MTALKDKIIEHFPLATPRPGQIESIEFALNAFNSGKRFVMLEAPTGAGKSVLGLTLSQFYQDSYYITIQKFLQDQLSKDFGEQGKHGSFMVDLKGRNAYECTYELNKSLNTAATIAKWKSRKHDCAEGHCRLKGKSKYDECISGTGQKLCPYFVQRSAAMASPVALMNFSSFLFQTRFTEGFDKRELLIIDEGHNIEGQLMDFVSLTLSSSDLDIKLPIFDTPEEYAQWLQAEQVYDQMMLKKRMAEEEKNPKKADEYEGTARKVQEFITEMSKEDHSPWVFDIKETKFGAVIQFKPIFIHEFAEEYLFSRADKILIMSATILNANVMRRSLGINKEEMVAKRLGCNFPIKNRPICYTPVAKATGGARKQHEWGPKITAGVDKIMDKYAGKKGIIHTHNFAISEMLLADCKRSARDRFLFQKNFDNKYVMMEEHADRKDSVIVAPAMHEGLDLKGNLSRFQIVCKMPFANFIDDKQLGARKDIDPEFYDWLTALKLVQSVGRSVRSETDWAHTFILDESFGWWYKRNKSKMIPKWFQEAVREL